MSMSRLFFLAFIGLGLLSAKEVSDADLNRILHELMAGNQRYVVNHPVHPHQRPARRTEVAKGQHPKAVILSCSDSRVPPELVFDQGIGDLFVIRMAGNVVDDDVLGTIEYAVEHLGASLIMVLGHERCGAVTAVVEGQHAEGHIKDLVNAISPAVVTVKGQPGDKIENAMKANVRNSVSLIEHDDAFQAHEGKAPKVKVVGARYDLDTGVVELLH